MVLRHQESHLENDDTEASSFKTRPHEQSDPGLLKMLAFMRFCNSLMGRIHLRPE